MLDFRIDTFLAVCEVMNLTRAAEVLGLTQPAVSQHIKALEERYHAKLLRYENKRLSLTPAGTLLRDTARTMRHDADSLGERMAALPDRERPVSFGVTLTIAEYEVPLHLSAMLAGRPARSLSLSVANTRELLAELDSGQIDFALIEGYFPRKDYDHELYGYERYVAVCAPASPLPRSACRLPDLLGERLLLREPGSGSRDILETYLRSQGFSADDFAARAEVGNISILKRLAEDGCGVAFLYETVVRRELEAGTLRRLALSDMSITHEFNFVWRKDSVFAPEYRALFRQLRDG